MQLLHGRGDHLHAMETHKQQKCSTTPKETMAKEELSTLIEAGTAPPFRPQEVEIDLQYGSISNANEQTEERPKRLSFAEDGQLLRDEMTEMAKLALPVTITYLLEMIPGIITIMLVGKMNEDGAIIDEDFNLGGNYSMDGEEPISMRKLHMDAAALAVMFVNIVAMSTGLGILSAMDTLCSQANGANQSSKMGTYLLTGIAIMTATLVLVILFVFNTTNILLALGQPPLVSFHAGVFAKWILPGVPFAYGYELLRKMSQSRSETLPMVFSAIVGIIVNTGVGYYLVNFTEWGFLGAAVANSLGRFVLVPSLILGMIYLGNDVESSEENTEHTDKEFLLHVLEGFKPSQALTPGAILQFLELGIPGMFQLMFEWGAFEIIALLCGILPNHNEALIAIGANSIVMNISSTLFMLYLGFAISGNVRIGNALGAGDAHRACMATYLTLSGASLLSLINMAFLVSFRTSLPHFFTSDLDQAQKAQTVLIVAAVFQLPDALNAAGQDILRACGRQALAAKLNFIAYYIIGLPFAYVLGILSNFGLLGLWFGLTIGLFCVALANTIIVLRSDWAKLSFEARQRVSAF